MMEKLRNIRFFRLKKLIGMCKYAEECPYYNSMRERFVGQDCPLERTPCGMSVWDYEIRNGGVGDRPDCVREMEGVL